MKDLNAIKELCPSAYDFLLNQAATAEVGKYDLETAKKAFEKHNVYYDNKNVFDEFC